MNPINLSGTTQLWLNPFLTQTQLWSWGQQAPCRLELLTLLGTVWDSIIREKQSGNCITGHLYNKLYWLRQSKEWVWVGTMSLHTAPPESYKLEFWPCSWHQPHFNFFWCNFAYCCFNLSSAKRAVFHSSPVEDRFLPNKNMNTKKTIFSGNAQALLHLHHLTQVCVFSVSNNTHCACVFTQSDCRSVR